MIKQKKKIYINKKKLIKKKMKKRSDNLYYLLCSLLIYSVPLNRTTKLWLGLLLYVKLKLTF